MSTKHKNMAIFPPFEYFNWLQPTGELSWRVNIRIYLPVSPLIDHFLTNNSSEFHYGGYILAIFFTRKADFQPVSWSPTTMSKKFFFLNVATHSGKLQRSYGGIYINRLGDIGDFVHTQKKMLITSPGVKCLLGKNYHWRGVRTGRK